MLPQPILLALMQPAAFWYAAGYLVGVGAFYAMARRHRFPGERLAGLCVVALLGGLAGAGVVQWVVSGSAGKTVIGGVLAGWAAVALYKRVTGFGRPTGDLFAVALMAGEAVGRLGCFAGGCCYGKHSEMAWAVFQQGAWRHPTQIYLAAACAGIFMALLWCDRRLSLPPNGLWAVQGILYCAARFTIEFYRDHNPPGLPPPEPAGLFSTAQWVTLAGVFFFAGYLARLLRRPKGAAVVPA